MPYPHYRFDISLNSGSLIINFNNLSILVMNVIFSITFLLESPLFFKISPSYAHYINFDY